MKPIRWDFLLSWSPEKAWWWGVLLGDGNVYAKARTPRPGQPRSTMDYRLSVCGSHSTVTRWMALISPEQRIHEFKRSPGTYQGIVNSREVVEWFLARGFGGPKAHSLPWPEDLPPEFRAHFLRGVWDSDGSLSIWDRRAAGRQGNPERKVSFGCATEVFVLRVRSELEVALPGLARVAAFLGHGVYRIGYASAPAQRVADYLYKDAPEHIRNEDRMDVYRKMVALHEHLETALCACGNPVEREGSCTACWYAQRPYITGEGTVCACGKQLVLAKGLCSGCYTRTVRAKAGWERKPTGTCACGNVAYRKGMCDACYSRERRARAKTATERMEA